VVVGPSQSHCYQHDPGRAEERKRNASRAGKRKGNSEISDLKKQLKDLAKDVLDGEVERGTAAVVNQILNTRLRAVEIECKIREQEELTERLEALESVLKTRREAR
jgi:hypothetical protein